MATTITSQQRNNDELYVKWKIPNFLERRDDLYYCRSPLFYFTSYSFILEIYPTCNKWFGALAPQALSMRLLKVENFSNENKNFEYIMGIIKDDLSEFRNVKYISKLEWNVPSTPAHELISRSDLEKFKNVVVPNGILTVFCNILLENEENCAVSVETQTLSKNDTAISPESSRVACICKGNHILSENFEALYRSKRLTDVTITVLDKEFYAHKVILSARSEVFNSMFQHDTSELRSGVVHITDCDPHSFEDFLLYLYTGKMDTVSSTNAVSLFKTADKYGVEELKRECIRYIIHGGMTVGSFCNIFHLAVLHSESDLLASATDFFIKNANSILITKEWVSLLEEHASLCNELLVKFAKSAMQK